MTPLLTRSNLRKLEAHLSRPNLFLFDFDGVLAPLIADRNAVRPRPETLKKLQKLMSQAQVVVVSGRGRQDVLRCLGLRPLHTVGNHGIEGLPSFRNRLAKVKKTVRTWDADLRNQPGIFDKGGDMENKVLSLTLHYRHAKHPQSVRRAIWRAIENLSPRPHVVLGKRVFNLVVKGAPNKGDAVRVLMRNLKAKSATYLGDDVTDEDVFRLKDSRLMTIRVGKKTKSAAQVYLPNQLAVDKFLDVALKQSAEWKKARK